MVPCYSQDYCANVQLDAWVEASIKHSVVKRHSNTAGGCVFVVGSIHLTLGQLPGVTGRSGVTSPTVGNFC